MVKEYVSGHTWTERGERSVRVGLSAAAIRSLGPIVSVDLPREGKHLNQGDVAVIVESTKAAIDIGAPVAGKVVSVNRLLHSEEGVLLLNEDPEGRGWLYEIDPS